MVGHPSENKLACMNSTEILSLEETKQKHVFNGVILYFNAI